MKVSLVRVTANPELLSGEAAALCYDGKNPARSLDIAIEGGHESVMEHASFTFLIEGVSRVLLAQITRHRLASFSVQSQRYVSYEKGFGYIVPPQIAALGPEEEAEYHRQMAEIHNWYVGWQEKLGKRGEGSNEDARYVLPGACETRLMMTMNVREILHFLSLRECGRAQWEIRGLAHRIHEICETIAPKIFRNAGPECVRTHCPEGKKSCGKPWKKEGVSHES